MQNQNNLFKALSSKKPEDQQKRQGLKPLKKSLTISTAQQRLDPNLKSRALPPPLVLAAP